MNFKYYRRYVYRKIYNKCKCIFILCDLDYEDIDNNEDYDNIYLENNKENIHELEENKENINDLEENIIDIINSYIIVN